MMKAINLYSFTRVDIDTATDFEKVLSNRLESKKIKKHEYQTLVSFVNQLVENDIALEKLSGFFYSFTIEHIGKEFDLLKICKDSKVLNIELKFMEIEIEKIKKQLRKNKYYLGHLASDLHLFTYIHESGKVLELKGDDLVESDFSSLISVIDSFEIYQENNIEKLFRARDFLISPLNTPERFLMNEYFLTQQQEEIKGIILEHIINDDLSIICGIKGKAGTGKTLLLYDIAKECSCYGSCCIIHCGMLCDGHRYLDEALKGIKIMSIKYLRDIYDLKDFDFIFVDETQRIKIGQFEMIKYMVMQNKKGVVFSFDDAQVLSKNEANRNIPQRLSLISGYRQFELTDKIRTNKEISSFIRNMLNLKDRSRIPFVYENVEILFSRKKQEAHKIIQLYTSKYQYEFICYTQSKYYGNSIDDYVSNINTHQVIGQEFDKVLIIMDNNFLYDSEGGLRGREHPNPDYLFNKLFLQAVTRAREKLCVLVIENYELFKDILSIKTGNILLNNEKDEDK